MGGGWDRALGLASIGVGFAATLVVAVAVSADYWLHTDEPIDTELAPLAAGDDPPPPAAADDADDADATGTGAVCRRRRPTAVRRRRRRRHDRGWCRWPPATTHCRPPPPTTPTRPGLAPWAAGDDTPPPAADDADATAAEPLSIVTMVATHSGLWRVCIDAKVDYTGPYVIR